jgi:hypothetical protein
MLLIWGVEDDSHGEINDVEKKHESLRRTVKHKKTYLRDGTEVIVLDLPLQMSNIGCPTFMQVHYFKIILRTGGSIRGIVVEIVVAHQTTRFKSYWKQIYKIIIKKSFSTTFDPYLLIGNMDISRYKICLDSSS